MKKNSKGDILAPVEFQIGVESAVIGGDVTVSLSTLKVLSVGYDSRDGEKYNPIDAVETISVEKAIRIGAVTVEQYQVVQKFFADLYDSIDATETQKEPSILDIIGSVA